MIDFSYVSDFQLINEERYKNWVAEVVKSEEHTLGQLDYIFCDDAYLLKINREYLDHDTYTDIITFDYTEGKKISGDVFISEERVRENANTFEVTFEEELLRVMAHGVLHLSGYGDKTKEDSLLMRAKEWEKMKLFHVEQ